MPNLTNLLGTAAVVVAIATGAHAQDDAKTQSPTADTVVATVNGTDITLGQMQVALSGLPPQYAQLDDETLFKGVLDQMIQQTALSEIGEGRKTKRDDIALEVQRRAADRPRSGGAQETRYPLRYRSRSVFFHQG